jgi:glycosidase
VVRHATRWNLGEDARRLLAGLLCRLRGSVCLYQGEELGLTEAYVAFEDLQDPYGIRFWPNSRAATAAARRWSGSGQRERRVFRRQALAAGGGGAMANLKLTDVEKTYGGHRHVTCCDIDLDIEQGEF